MDITVELVPPQMAVRLTATGAVGDVAWYEDQGATDRAVGTGGVVIDRAAPLNRPLTYFATDDEGSAIADPITISTARSHLGSTLSSDSHPVTVVSWRPLEGEGRTVWHPILGRPDPFVTIHPAQYPAGLLRLLLADAGERERLLRLLQPGDPLLLRTACPERAPTMTFVMTAWSDPFLGDGRRDGRAYLDVSFQQVTESVGLQPPPADRNYATLPLEAADYAALKALHATYLAVMDGP